MLLIGFIKKLCPGLTTLHQTGRILKIVSFCLLAACLQLSARSAAQGLSLSFTNAGLPAIFSAIQQQTPYRFVYTNEQVASASPVSINVQNVSLEKVLELCFKDQPLGYSLEDKFIIVKTKEKKIIAATAPENEVRGRVSNENNEGIAGASVALKGSARGVSTDGKGGFALSDVPPGAVILISSIGYESREIIIGNNRNLEIRLRTAVNALDEMVIKGYYSTSKRLNTGSVSKLNAAAIEQQGAPNPLQAMAGRMPGVYIAQNTGLPGSSFTVNIRGLNSIASGNAPFYIIDGVPFTATSIASKYTSIATLGGNPLSTINPSDIESIEVLKDADATAIYGSRGANGVVLITTKKGKPGKTKWDIGYTAGWGKIAKQFKLLNTTEYLAVRREAFANDGTLPTIDNAPDLLLWDTTRNTDWQKYAYGGTAQFSDGQVSISGGNEQTRYLVSGAYHRESTVYERGFADGKGSVHVNLDNNSLDGRFTMRFSASYITEKNRLPFQDITKNIMNLAPDAPPVFKTDGSLNWENNFNNPFALLLNRYTANSENLVSNAQLGYELIPGLEIKTSLGYTQMNMLETVTTPKTSFDPAYQVSSGYANYANGSLRTWIIEPQLMYKWAPGKQAGVLNFLVGTTIQENTRQSLTQEGRNYPTDQLLDNIAAAGSIKILNNTYTRYRYNAVFARINYNVKNTYLLNITGRRDGSSRFGPGRQFANFGAVGAGWVFSKEKLFSKLLPVISFGKLRASYGSSGNDQIPDYGYLGLWSPTTFTYQSQPGLTPTRLFNADFGWETNTKLEFALELGFLKDRILLTTGYYRNRSGNQLVGYPLPAITGQLSIQANLPAVVQNTGVELELSTQPVRTAQFSWQSSINLSIPGNRLLEYPNLAASGFRNTYAVGKSLYVKKLFHTTGVDPQTGVYQFDDFNKNGNTLDYPDDMQFLKDIAPRYFGGWQNSLRYKGFQLDFLFQFVKQEGINYLYTVFDAPGTLGNQPALVLDRWQKQGDNKPIQRYTQEFTDAYNAYSYNSFLGDATISDASFIRLRNLFLSWSLPEKSLKKLHLQACRFSISGQNLFTHTKYLGIDPENQYSSSIPPLRVLMAGIKLTF